MPKPILDQLADGPVLGDGGYVYLLKQRGVPMKDYTPYGALTHAEAVRQLYQEFFAAGVDVIQAQTFQGTRNRLERIGMADRYEEIHRRAVDLVREVVGREVLVAGSIGSAVGSRGLAAAGLTTGDARALYQEGFLAMQPVGVRCWPEYAYLGHVPDWTQRVLSPSAMAAYAREAASMGVNYIGSCCGSGPDQVRAMAEALGKTPRG